MKIYKGDQNFMKSPPKKPSIFKKAVKGIVKKGIKFAVNPLTLSIAAGAGAIKVLKKSERIAGRSKSKQYTRKGNWIA
jgi:hypothetical protein